MQRPFHLVVIRLPQYLIKQGNKQKQINREKAAEKVSTAKLSF